MTAQEIETMRRERSDDFNAHVAVAFHGWKRVKEWPHIENGDYLVTPNGVLAGWWLDDGSFIWHAFQEPARYATDPAADYATLALVNSKWPKRKRGEFHIACRELWEARGYLGSDPWQMYQIGDYSSAALAVVSQEPA